MGRLLLAALLALAAAGTAAARDLAILLVNERYENHPTAAGAGRVLSLEADFRRAGYDVEIVRDFARADIGEVVPAGWRRQNARDRLVFVVAGHVLQSHSGAWLLARDAGATPDIFSVGTEGVALDALLHVGLNRPGKVIVAVAQTGGAPGSGFGLRPGVGWVQAPQGVALAFGPAGPLTRFIARDVLAGARPLFFADRDDEDVTVRGFKSRSEPFQPASARPPRGDEAALWQAVRQEDTLAGYRRYLDRFPQGRFAEEARQRIAALQETPAERAERIEAALNLTRAQRRQVQSDLTVLGFDPRGIDGIFGRGTRTAIQAWQRSIGVPDHGFLNANQISRLDQTAERRRAELEAEAEQRRAEAERADRAFWDRTGATGTEDGLRAYLGRYPDGLYSETARARLREIEREARRRAEAEEREAWNRAVMEGTANAYRGYLERFPEGLFAAEARARIAAIEDEPDLPRDVIEQARQEEEDLRLNPITARLIETRLQQLGYDTGAVDGRFTRDTRRALRRYQRDNDLRPTGYVTRATVVRLVVSLDQ